jgi:hypothetical protein
MRRYPATVVGRLVHCCQLAFRGVSRQSSRRAGQRGKPGPARRAGDFECTVRQDRPTTAMLFPKPLRFEVREAGQLIGNNLTDPVRPEAGNGLFDGGDPSSSTLLRRAV